jgi:hypothetical protein
MTAPHCPSPDRGMIGRFADLVFGSCEGWVAARCFPERGMPGQRRTPFIRIDGNLALELSEHAETAAENGLALFVVPGPVARPGSAKAADISAFQTVLIDIDQGDICGKTRTPCRVSRPALTHGGFGRSDCRRSGESSPLLAP